VKYVTVRLIVSESRARKIEAALEATADGNSYFGLIVEPETLHGFEIDDQAELDGTNTGPKEKP